MPAVHEQELRKIWQSGGVGREALREELAPTRVIVDYGYGYRCFPNVGFNGEAVFTVHSLVFPPPNGKPIICKVFRLEGFADAVEIGDLHATDSKAILANQPFVTRDGSIIVPTLNAPDYTHMAIWRYKDGVWNKVYEDTGADVATITHFAQDPYIGNIYGGYNNGVKSIVLKSTDDGETWSKVYESVEASPSDAYIYSCGTYRQYVVLTKRNKRTFIRSSDHGATWTESPVLPTKPRCVSMFNDLGMSFITSDSCIYYSRDQFATYKRIKVQPSGSPDSHWTIRYPVRVGGRFLLSAVTASSAVFLASRDLYHTVTPVFSVEGFAARIAGYGDYLLVGAEYNGFLVRVRLPKTLEKGMSCPILLWESESVTDTTNGSTTDLIDTGYNDKKTFYIISDQSGTLYIQAYDEVTGDFKDIDSISVSADTLTPYMTTYDARLMRLRFVPSAAATVSAWVVLE